MSLRWFNLLLASAALSFVGCGGQSAAGSAQDPSEPLALAVSESGLEVALYSLRKQTLTRGSNQVRLELSTGSDAELLNHEVRLSTFMPAMGHGPSEQPQLVTTEGNRYTFEKVVINMPGLWELRVDVSGELSDELVFELDVE